MSVKHHSARDSHCRACADAVYDPAGPRAAAKTHSLRLGAAASQLPRVEASGVAGLRHCIGDVRGSVAYTTSGARVVSHVA